MFDAAWWALGGAIAGLVAGSFIGTLVIRWPAGRTLKGRSACDGCGRSLGARDLIPLLSAILVRGRCRTCGKPIDWRHSTIEAGAALIGVVAMIALPGLDGVAAALFGWQLLTLAALDAEHYWLPDCLTGVLALTGLAFGVAGVGVDLSARMIGGAAGFASLFVIAWIYRNVRRRDGMGGGDPKLLGAIGCWMGWQPLPYVLVGASLIGLTFVLILKVRGSDVRGSTRLALGTLMAVAALPLYLLIPQL